jgi:two-component system chemotaxis response regulator CheY
MKTLIVEDDFTTRLIMHEILKQYGPAHVAVNGKEAVVAIGTALKDGKRYDLVCLDIMMPEMDGKEALKQIRAKEEAQGILAADQRVKIIMTTALDDIKNINASFRDLADAYLVKPIDKAKMLDELRKLKLIK